MLNLFQHLSNKTLKQVQGDDKWAKTISLRCEFLRL